MRGLFVFIFISLILITGILYLFYFYFPKEIELNTEIPFQYLKKDNPPLLEEKNLYLKDYCEIRKNFISEKKDFIEANLSEMKIKIYEKGDLIKEVPIFRKGNAEKWGGTCLGSYKILSKHELAYSTLAGSYMPWSLHIYGKYYIHGDNYYPDRGIDTLPITGGCLRLSNDNAKTIYNIIEVGMPILVTDKGMENDDYKYPWCRLEEFPQLSSPSYLVADLDSGFVFAEKDYQKKMPIASITKLMTATVVAEIVDLRKFITITPKMIETPGDTNGLIVGKQFRAFELFYPLLTESSNNAAEALSYFLGREKTIELMNEKAKAILMTNTEFADPSGLSPKNVSTAEDLFYLARYILNSRPMFLNISRGEEVWTFDLKSSFENLKNKNLSFEDPDFLGGKTGYLPASKNTGVFIFRLPVEDNMERNIVIILLGSEGIKDDAQKIYQWLQKRTSLSFRPEQLEGAGVYLSSDRLEQGDTLLVRFKKEAGINKISGEFGTEKIDFFKSVTGEWIAIVGIDIKKEPGKYNLIIDFLNGNKFKKEIEIVKREFPTTELLVTEELKEKGYTPSNIVKNITDKDNPNVYEILQIYTPTAHFNQAFIYPLAEIKDVGAFGNIRESENLAIRHLGIDLEANIGTPVYAINNGVVCFSEDLNTYGKTLIINHGLGIYSLYLHLDNFKVLSGERVKRGDIIGLSGNTGYSISPHLHFSIKINAKSVDPLRFIETIEKEMLK